MQYEIYPFELLGWIWREYIYNRLDEYDPHASQLDFPPYQVGQSIVDRLGLSADSEQREWFLSNTEKASILCELWSTNKPRRDEERLRYGNRMSASLVFLKRLCSTLERELIIEIQINRKFKRNSFMRVENGSGYKPPHSQIYILSADGKLRDSKTHYQLR
jgi:hypothetical protein